jgi:hypothetical protein
MNVIAITSMDLSLFGDDAISPLYERNKNCRSAKFCSPLLQVCFRNPTGAGAGPSRKDLNALRHDLVPQFAQRRPTDGKDRLSRNIAH